MQTSYVALLRGINVGGKNKLPMKELLEMFVEAGCSDVRNYIQSGNVVFRAEPAVAASLPSLITVKIAERFNIKVPVMLRTAEQIEAVVRHNPFLEDGSAEEMLYVIFLAERPSASRISDLDPDRSPPDAFFVREQEVYLHLPNGGARSRLTTSYFDSKLATISTARNWRTVTRLLEMIGR